MDFKLKEDDILDVGDELTGKFSIEPEPQEVGYIEEEQEKERQDPPVTEKIADVVEEETQEAIEGKTWTPSEIKQDPQAMEIIRGEMVGVRGLSKNTPDDELFTAWIRHHRGLAAGNSVRVATQLTTAKVSNDLEKSAMLESAKLFESLEGVNSDDYTWGETIGGYFDYARSLILDPVNLVGGAVGKVAGTATTKTTTVALRETLKAGWKRHALKEGAKKSTVEAIESTIKEGGEAALKGSQKKIYEQAVGQAVRAGSTEAGGELLKGTAKKATLTAVAAGTAADAATATGVEYARQQGMVKIGDQAEIDRRAVGLAAIGSVLVGGGSAWVTREGVAQGFQRNAYDTLVGKEDGLKRVIARDAAETVSNTEDMGKTLEGALASTWQSRVERGELTNTGIVDEVISTVIFGDTETGAKGIARILVDNGVEMKPRFKGDKINEYLIDVINELPEEEADIIVDTVRDALKKKKWKLTDPAGKAIDLDTMDIEQLTDIYAANLSKGASALGRSGAFAKEIEWAKGKTLAKATSQEMKDAAETFFGIDELPAEIAELSEPRRVQAIQDTLIQTLVSHPGTTALNVKGSTMAFAGEVISDAAEAIIYGGQGAVGYFLGNKSMKQRGILHMKARAGALKDLTLNLLRPQATLQEFDSYGLLRPDAFEEISGHYAGGVKKVDLEEYGISGMDKVSRGVVKGLDAYKDVAQKVSFVSAQDRFFKSQMMGYSMSKNVRIAFGKDVKSVIKDEGYRMFKGDKWANIEAKVIADVADVTYSRKFGKAFGTTYNPLEYVATVFEEARKVRGLGMLMPFGRFFNNTMNFTATYTGVKALAQISGMAVDATGNVLTKGVGAVGDDITEEGVRSFVKNFTKGGVGLGLVAYYMDGEEERVDAGLGMFETVNEDGTIEDHTFNYPYNLVLGISRLGHRAYKTQDGIIPPEESEEFLNAFGIGALTRTAESALTESFGIVGQLFAGQTDPITAATTVAQGVTQTVVSAATRPLDPANELVAVVNESGYQNYDKKDWLNQALRYVDQMPLTGAIAASRATGQESGEPVTRNDATSDREQIRTNRMFGSNRFSHSSYTQKVMNHVGKAEWRVNEWQGTPEINQYVNDLRELYLEDEMEFLWKRKSFKNAELTARQQQVSTVMQRVDERVKDRLTLAGEDLAPYVKAYTEFNNKYTNEAQINRAKQIAKIDKEVAEMDPFELDKIAETIEGMKEGLYSNK